jgi:hypothetical protein
LSLYVVLEGIVNPKGDEFRKKKLTGTGIKMHEEKQNKKRSKGLQSNYNISDITVQKNK